MSRERDGRLTSASLGLHRVNTYKHSWLPGVSIAILRVTGSIVPGSDAITIESISLTL